MIRLQNQNPVDFTADEATLAALPRKLAALLPEDKRDKFAGATAADNSPKRWIIVAAILTDRSELDIAREVGLRAVPSEEQIEALARSLHSVMRATLHSGVREQFVPDVAHEYGWLVTLWCCGSGTPYDRVASFVAGRLHVLALARAMGLLP